VCYEVKCTEEALYRSHGGLLWKKRDIFRITKAGTLTTK